jgi:hypothetical protein
MKPVVRLAVLTAVLLTLAGCIEYLDRHTDKASPWPSAARLCEGHGGPAHADQVEGVSGAILITCGDGTGGFVQ